MAGGLFGTNTPDAQLQQQRLQPAATPGSTFVRPVQAQTGGNLRALTDALGSLNGSLQQYGQVQDKINDNPESLANREWIAQRQQMTSEELRAEAAAGTPNGIRVRQDALDGLLGERGNADWRQDWGTHYNTDFDRSNGDVAGDYDARRAEFAEGLPSEIARGNFYRLTEPHRATVIAEATGERIASAKQQINTTIIDSWHTQIADATKSGSADVGALAASIMDSAASNQTFYGQSQKEQEGTIYGLAERVALEGKPELAKAILNAPRKGPDGSTLPSLASMPAYATKSASLVESANGVRTKLDDEQSFPLRAEVDRKLVMGELTEEDVKVLPDTLYSNTRKAALLTQSEGNRQAILTRTQTAEHKAALARYADQARFDVQSSVMAVMGQVGGAPKLKDVQVPTASGGTETYTREAQIEDVRTLMESRWEDQEAALVAQNMDPAEAAQQMQGVRLAWYEANNVHNEQWADMFSGLPVAANADVLMKNPEAAANFTQTADLYRQIKASNPAYAATLLDPKSRDFLDSYDMAVTFNRMTPNDAIGWAAGWAAKTDTEKARLTIKPQDADRIVGRVLRRIGAEAHGESSAIINQKLQAMSALGMNEGAMERNLRAWAEDSTYVINGMAMPAMRDLPQDFPILADMELDRVFAERGEALGIEDSEDLFLQPVSGETKWQVWSKTVGGPVGNVFVTPESLDSQRQAQHQTRIAAANAEKDGDQQSFNDYVAHQRSVIQWHRENRGKLGRWAADGWERDLEEYIQSRDPNHVAAQRAARQSEERELARANALNLGFADPFPGQ